MDSRQLFAAFIGTIVLTLGIASVVEPPVHKLDLTNHKNTLDKPKAPRLTAQHASEAFEIPSRWDEGSLWDQGPAYDMSRYRE
jgi:hypothetical protein